jgi:tRNA threonylcarbamoyladenosine modification (KEOPS) complex Cgi121 subunit
MIDLTDEGLAVTAVAGPLKLDDALFVAKKSCRIAPLQVVRADRVLGLDHVRHAARLAARAAAEGRAQAEKPEVEFLRYLAGERQIGVALEKLGLPDVADGAVVVGLGPKGKDAVLHFLHALGLEEDEALLDPSEAKLLDFGVTPLQLEATTPAKRLDLVLEAVSSVDLK